MAAYVGVAIFLVYNLLVLRNEIRAGIVVMLTGWVLNALVIGLNGAMPLSLWAYQTAGLVEPPTPGTGGFFKIEIADQSSLLRFLGDVIPIRLIHQVVSVGDLLLVVGIGMVIFQGMRATLGEAPGAES